MKKVSRIVLAASLLLVSPTLLAALVPHDLAATSDGLLTYDTVTQLEWLDLPLTAGLPYVQVQTQLTSPGAFAGFRYATELEVTTLFAHAGLTTTSGAFVNNGQLQNALTLIQLLGQTGFPSGGFPGPAIRGIYGETTNGTHPFAGVGVRSADGFTSVIIGASPLPISFPDTSSNPSIGSFLVRQVYNPIPTLGWPVLTLLTCLVGGIAMRSLVVQVSRAT